MQMFSQVMKNLMKSKLKCMDKFQKEFFFLIMKVGTKRKIL